MKNSLNQTTTAVWVNHGYAVGKSSLAAWVNHSHSARGCGYFILSSGLLCLFAPRNDVSTTAATMQKDSNKDESRKLEQCNCEFAALVGFFGFTKQLQIRIRFYRQISVSTALKLFPSLPRIVCALCLVYPRNLLDKIALHFKVAILR